VTHTAAHATRPPAADPAFAAVIFDMDGVVTDTAGLHAAAWQAIFDQVLPILAASRDVEPFDIEADYHAHIDGRSRETACAPSWPPAAWPFPSGLRLTGRTR
jgi:hypothetical protein